MGTKEPCFHCGIEDSPIWITGPSQKPILCNLCGSWWKTSGTLESYIPKNATDAQSSQTNLCPVLNPTSPTKIPNTNKQKLFGSNDSGNDGPSFAFRSTIVGLDQSRFVFKAGICPRSGYGITLLENNTQTQNAKEDIQAPLSKPNNIPWKNGSTLEQQVSSSIERLHQQLCITLGEQSIGDEEDPENLLIFERINKYIPENEIGLGCVLLKPPSSPDSNSQKIT